MSGKANGSGGGLGVLSVLGIVFAVLKLCGVINWSWWLVLLPFWGPAAFALAVLAFVFLWIAAVKYTTRNTR